jgi:S1-C subfamily serine protease
VATGDVIVSLNGMPIHNMQELRGAIHQVTGGKPAVVQIERSGRFLYIEREMEERPSDSSTDRGGKGESMN